MGEYHSPTYFAMPRGALCTEHNTTLQRMLHIQYTAQTTAAVTQIIQMTKNRVGENLLGVLTL